MYLTQEQSNFIIEHLANPEKALAIGATARKLVMANKEMSISERQIESDNVGITALVMNIGETSENMKINGVNIYSKEYGPWDENAKKLNELKGLESISMANSQSIELSDEAKKAIIACSRGGSLNNMAITLKVAQTLEAIKYPRWSRGEKKEPAKDIEEVSQIISEEIEFMLRNQEIDNMTKENIHQTMVTSARNVYYAEKQQEIRKKLGVMSWDEVKSMQEFGIDFDDSNQELGARLDNLLLHVSENDIDSLYQQVEDLTSVRDDMSTNDREIMIDSTIKKWEKKYNLIETDDIEIK